MVKVQDFVQNPQVFSPLLLTFFLYGDNAGLCAEAPTVLPLLLIFSMYSESAGLLRDAPTVLPLLLIFSLYLESAGLCTEGLTGINLATHHLPV
jgi:hypothetical protein